MAEVQGLAFEYRRCLCRIRECLAVEERFGEVSTCMSAHRAVRQDRSIVTLAPPMPPFDSDRLQRFANGPSVAMASNLPNLRRLFVEARTEAEESAYSRNAVRRCSSLCHYTTNNRRKVLQLGPLHVLRRYLQPGCPKDERPKMKTLKTGRIIHEARASFMSPEAWSIIRLLLIIPPTLPKRQDWDARRGVSAREPRTRTTV